MLREPSTAAGKKYIRILGVLKCPELSREVPVSSKGADQDFPQEIGVLDNPWALDLDRTLAKTALWYSVLVPSGYR